MSELPTIDWRPLEPRASRCRQSTSEVVDVLDALFELGAALFAPAPTQPYR